MSPHLLFKAAVLAAMFVTALPAQTSSFEKRFEAIRSRPEYRHSRFGVEFYSIEDGKVLYAWNPQELFVPGSTTKLLSLGSALELLGPDFRFHTRVYRTGPLKDGTLEGDLILLASGDPDLSNRIQPDGTMVFENEDHSYDGFAESKPVPGDPLTVIRELASKVTSSGIHRVTGRVAVDISLFPEGTRELGTRVVISPIVVNDNVVDVMVTPGAREGDPAALEISPKTTYVNITNQVKTAAVGSKMHLEWANDTSNPDGTHNVSLSGAIPSGAPPKLRVYKVPTPSRFAEVVFTEALESAGVQIGGGANAAAHATDKLLYTRENEVAEHVSPPLKEEAKITLKVSQNLHASMMPYIVGAYLQKESPQPLQAGFDHERAMLQQAGLDLTGAVQNDGAGGAALFAPDFIVQFLLHITKQPFFQDFKTALPILGKDGSLFNIETDSPAAGHVFAKTGTMGGGNALAPGGGVIEGKGLADFIETKDGRHLAFAAYINFVSFATMNESATRMVGEALGEVSAAAYDGFRSDRGTPDRPKPDRLKPDRLKPDRLKQ
ncbi:MAG: D-alanyl-D-alanine carboxypeptidase/D-alanyl-D-alanine endopeptidase [Bryobacteraceae bacterium]